MSKDKDTIEPIPDTFDNVVEIVSHPAPHNTNKNNDLTSKNALQPAPIKQYVLDLGVEVEKTINGIEMGVLENGIPYLTQAGLAEVCGVARSVIYDIGQDWVKNYNNNVIGKDRNSVLKEALFKNGYNEPNLFIETESNGNFPHGVKVISNDASSSPSKPSPRK